MTPGTQACAGLAMVMGVAMLCTRRTGAVWLCLLLQSAAAVAAALFAGAAVRAIPPIVTLAAIGALRHRVVMPDDGQVRRAAVVAGLAFALLSQTAGETGVPLAVMLLAVLLAAVRRGGGMRLIALAGLQNGLVLTGLPAADSAVLPALACGVFVLPAAAGFAGIRVWPGGRPWTARAGQAEFIVCAALFAATVTQPVNTLASVFAPLIAFDGLERAWLARDRLAAPVVRRGLSVVKLGCCVAAVCAAEPVLAWMAIAGAAAASILPLAGRRPEQSLLACLAAGLVLFGLLIPPDGPDAAGYLGLFGGAALLAAAIPDLAIPVLVLILRVTMQDPLPPDADALAIAVPVAALLTCAACLLLSGRRDRTPVFLGQAAIAALAIATRQPDGRFAGVVLLILLSLVRTGTRVPGQTVAARALAGPGTVPGLVLAILALSSHAPWCLLPAGLGLVPIMLTAAATPVRAPPASLVWLPLILAVLFGWFAPEALIQWLASVTAGTG